jgi:uncharacterized membrane protein
VEGLIVLIVLAILLAPLVMSAMALSRSRDAASRMGSLQETVDELSRRLARLERRPISPPVSFPVSPSEAPAAAPIVAPPVAAPAPPASPPAVAPAAPADRAGTIPPPVSVPRAAAPEPAGASAAFEPSEPVAQIESGEPAEPSAAGGPWRWFVEGNPLAKLGVLLMFFGLAYLLRYVSERGWLSIELRLAGAAAISLILLAIGWHLRHRQRVYALTLQGGAVGAFYFTSFAAFRLYSVLESGLVFGLMIVICAASVVLAVAQRSQSLAVLGSLGGYLAPILLSTGGGNHVALFSYYTLLSIGILAISRWQVWRPLNLIGFAFTFGVGAMWGASRYTPELYTSTQIFLAINVVIYGVLAVLASSRVATDASQPFVDGTLLFGTPLLGFGLQVGLTEHWRYGPAFSAMAFATLYLPLAAITLPRQRERARLIAAAFLVIGAGFATLAIPLALSARWTSLAWAFEGLGILWLGCRQDRWQLRWSGTGLLAAAAYTAWMALVGLTHTPTFLLLTSAIAVTWLAGARLWFTQNEDGARMVSRALLVGGVLAWAVFIAGGSSRIWGEPASANAAILIAAAVTAIVWNALRIPLAWSDLAEASVLLWIVAAGSLLDLHDVFDHAITDKRLAFAWLAALAAMWHVLGSARHRAPIPWRGLQHAAFWWGVVALALTEASWRLNRLGWGTEEWRAAGLIAAPASVIVALWWLFRRSHWMTTAHPTPTLVWGALPAVIAAVYFLGIANLLDGRMPGYPYIPLVNPIEEAAALGLLALVAWRRAAGPLLPSDLRAMASLSVIALLVWWLNGLFLRTLATVLDVPWSAPALWESATIQAAIAIVWTIAALVCMAIGARRGLRQPWFAGALALAAVVAKLFLVDSARGGGIARAVAFLGVAALVLIIGYLAPLPPRAPKPSEGTAP